MEPSNFNSSGSNLPSVPEDSGTASNTVSNNESTRSNELTHGVNDVISSEQKLDLCIQQLEEKGCAIDFAAMFNLCIQKLKDDGALEHVLKSHGLDVSGVPPTVQTGNTESVSSMTPSR